VIAGKGPLFKGWLLLGQPPLFLWSLVPLCSSSTQGSSFPSLCSDGFAWFGGRDDLDGDVLLEYFESELPV